MQSTDVNKITFKCTLSWSTSENVFFTRHAAQNFAQSFPLDIYTFFPVNNSLTVPIRTYTVLLHTMITSITITNKFKNKLLSFYF